MFIILFIFDILNFKLLYRKHKNVTSFKYNLIFYFEILATFLWITLHKTKFIVDKNP